MFEVILLTTVTRLIPVPLAELTNEAWKYISEQSGLPPEARPSIDSTIAFCRVAETALKPEFSPALTKKALAEASVQAKQLRTRLQNLVINPLVLVGLTLTMASKEEFSKLMSDRTGEAIIDAQIAALAQLERSLKTASAKIARARPGATRKAKSLVMLVKFLDEILFEFTGRHVTRGRKGKATGHDYIAAVCTVAGLAIGPGSIDDAIKQVMERRGGNTAGAIS
jgi:hypothetical protein